MKAFHLNAPAPYYTNSFLLISDGGSGVIIDGAADAHLYLEKIEEAGAKLVAILQTHGHQDHTYSIGALRSKTGARLHIAKADADQFGIQADAYLTDGETLTFDELSFTVIATPGHTPGSVCIRCGDLLFTGDTLFCGDIGRTDLPSGSYTQIQQSLAKLCETVQDDPQVLPGHEMFSTMETERRQNRYLR